MSGHDSAMGMIGLMPYPNMWVPFSSTFKHIQYTLK